LQGRVRNNQTRIDKEEGEKKCSSKNKKTKQQNKKQKSSSFRYFDPLRSDDSVLIVDVFL